MQTAQCPSIQFETLYDNLLVQLAARPWPATKMVSGFFTILKMTPVKQKTGPMTRPTRLFVKNCPPNWINGSNVVKVKKVKKASKKKFFDLNLKKCYNY